MTVRAPEVPHKVIGPYEVLHKLGEGGMGSVYKARHSRTGQKNGRVAMTMEVVHGSVSFGRFRGVPF